MTAPGAELALAARLQFSLGPFPRPGSGSDLRASSGLWRVAPVFRGGGPSEHLGGRQPEPHWR